MKPKVQKIKRLLRENNIDGVIVNSPENFTYITAYSSHQHTVSRQAHFAVSVLDNKEESRAIAIGMDFESEAFSDYMDCIVKKYSTWVGGKTFEEVLANKEVVSNKTFVTSLDVVVESIKELNLEDKKVGIELDFISATYFDSLKRALPNVDFVNVSNLFIEARSVKEDDEIEYFRKLARVADEALLHTSQFVKEGVSERELFDIYCKKVMESGICFPSGWSSFCAGENSGRLCRSTDRIIKNGDVVKFDGGVNGDTNFYTTDFSRSWIVGDAHPVLSELKQRLVEAQRLMIDSVKPGLGFDELFSIGFNYVKEKYKFYERGHLGHSISMGPQTAESPFISLSEKRKLEVGMILCIETPCYISGFGGFNIEDMILVTEDGCEVLTPLTPHYK
ncbi:MULTISPECIES: M24 family metallopeptidase [Romboutsia]|uniref:M24 family metallopeptidase n=1 Tax=Romboutsia TaxID=1501226 RepID=UPI001897187A|nr:MULTISPECIES: Xaa-Pro peptidase family protein [Romboutsia]MCH1960874.1 Xaa-Pro peptidase family protein [Romboutsia hominis]MCH1968693.1 Xaa-Pro peptidase family protein [Romboutsia hominis]MDB8789654.1 Xaa-Pro peptidase family protein [Romboutsia sp. 1001216sp1]MDB8801802.1 Xaa-Pro peptidase family protein [Romboutsia sp. 1001216sp1]MDB8804434.1 Xaa-Pro peptidase family protein [Romboutsia sp. 1001216sp1]